MDDLRGRRRRTTALSAVIALSALASACGEHAAAASARDSIPAASPRPADAERSLATVPDRRNGTAAAAAAGPRVLFIGTSLTAGLGLDPSDAFPEVTGRMLDSAGHPARIVNAGVSGETSAGARSRIGWVLREPADVIVIETGANDGLRGLPVSAARENIQAILDSVRLKQPSARVLLVQMEAPPNLGAAYTTAFHAMYPDLAKKNGVELVPFLLGGVAGIPSLNQEDGIHPNRAGARIVARNVYDALVKRPPFATTSH